jgi:hypothetical protein
MSINDQVAGWGAVAVFAMREDTIDRNSQQDRSPPKENENPWHRYSFSILSGSESREEE